ncbi:MAG: hypothetical protein ONB17_07420, partial [candidate division KSB1 bacterium]|nr:hypothetical protein [candidate division KSB1 bacterium]
QVAVLAVPEVLEDFLFDPPRLGGVRSMVKVGVLRDDRELTPVSDNVAVSEHRRVRFRWFHACKA